MIKLSNVISILLLIFNFLNSSDFNKSLTTIPDIQTQSETFSIITPYYGTKDIRSFFDHNAPNFVTNNVFVRYDGQQWTGNVDISNCTNFTNCYDGHNGLDVDMDYEQVISAADGIVWWADYTIPNCHNGSNCSYGMQVKIKHTINGEIYSTRYAHLTTIAIEVGQLVTSGKIIGTSGSTGASTGPHLHFDVSICINTICADDNDFRPIDPFGWQPIPESPIQLDPWALAQNPNGADSWCLWRDGQFVNLCNPNRISNPIKAPLHGDEIIVDDSIYNIAGFSKGFNGSGNNICVGIDPACREWWETNGTGWGNHTYRTITNGLAGNFNSIDNWAKWKPQVFTPGNYEILVYVPEYLGFSNDTFTWQAHFSVLNSSAILENKIVDEYIGEGQAYNPRNKWLSLGIHSLDSNSAVYLYDDKEPPTAHCPNGAYANGYYWCRVAADAVKYVQIKYIVFLPTIIKSEDLVYNGGFETGDTSGWVAYRTNNLGPIVIQYQNSIQYGARLGRYDNNQDLLYQTIEIPNNINHATWSYKVFVYTEETLPNQIFDQMDVKITDIFGNTLFGPDLDSNLTYTPNGQYVTISHDVTMLAGQTVRIYFYAITDSTLNTWFWIDDVILIVN